MPTPPATPTNVDEYAEWNDTLLSRSRISRRGMLKAAAAGAGAVAVSQFAIARAAFAADGGTSGKSGLVVSGRHLSWVSDSAGDPTNAIRLTAQLHTPTGKLPSGLRGFVDIGSSAGHYGRSVPVEIVHLQGMYAIPNGPIGSQFYLKAQVTGLDAGSVHHYRFRLSDGTRTGDAHFSTAPSRKLLGTSHAAPAPFTFTAFGDVGTNAAPKDPRYAWGADPDVVKAADGVWKSGVFDDNYYNTADPVAGTNGRDRTPAVTLTRLQSTQRPVFTLLAGDICYADPGGSGLPADNTGVLTGATPTGKNAYNPYVWDTFLNQIESQAAYTPWMFATGNHDMEPLYGNTKLLGDSANHGYGGHVARLDLPKNGPHGCPSVYSFTYANIGVISVDANELSFEIQTNLGYSGGGQLQWLENTLAKWRTGSEASKLDFIVVFFHHCAYSTTSNHASDGGVRDALDPLFSKYQVDLVAQGHNHVMERTDPIKNKKRTKAAPDGSTVHPAKDGVVYYTIGSGGRPRYSFQPAVSSTAPAPASAHPTGVQLLPSGQRYRGYKAPATENGTENVVNSYVWSKDGTAVNNSGYPQGTKVPEAIDWSQVRYDDYAFIAVDVKPGRAGQKTTLTIRTLADALPGSGTPYTEIDRLTLERTAGKSGVSHSGATGASYETPSGLLLPGGVVSA